VAGGIDNTWQFSTDENTGDMIAKDFPLCGKPTSKADINLEQVGRLGWIGLAIGWNIPHAAFNVGFCVPAAMSRIGTTAVMVAKDPQHILVKTALMNLPVAPVYAGLKYCLPGMNDFNALLCAKAATEGMFYLRGSYLKSNLLPYTVKN